MAMQVLTTTPFGQRPMTTALLDRARDAQRPASVPEFDKWELFRELCAGRAAYGIGDRELTVLNALLSFHPGKVLAEADPLIVFPSNAALSERAHGMAESTLRRHLASLVAAGLIARHDSPNGKRYAARGADGGIARAFGFDLRPLLVEARRIASAAAEARAAAEALRRLREDLTLLKRDAVKLTVYGRESGLPGDWEGIEARLLDIHRQMRRRLDRAELEILKAVLSGLLSEIRVLLVETENPSGSDGEIGRHYQNSNPDLNESEPCQEMAKETGMPFSGTASMTGTGAELAPGSGTWTDSGSEPATDPGSAPSVASIRSAGSKTPDLSAIPGGTDAPPVLPLALVLKACPDILDYAPSPPRHWHELVALAGFVRGMMGISADAWAEAERAMGAETAAITVAAILQRVSEIQSPGGYLRALSRKAAQGGFSPGPMVMALLRPMAA
ncbi:plasmid replication protein RepC [Rhodovulum sulfidophilum]|uniref:plasmid replication protein RepC n=2 Tax=Rhodovulum sulfidophilum TaxID=35806 RepID=UPI0009D6FB39|nr:plasmid replication protein RepC [Rhodovulum sulfidophilum]MBL3552857.1 replication initiation protein RepC [Rhodovulum sulfidophilum]